MPGLLDFLNSDDARLGIGLLAAGGPTSDPNQAGFGQRLAAGMQFADQSRRGKLQEDLLRSQMAENESQAATRQAALARQARMDDYYMGGGFGGGSSSSASGIPEGAALKAATGVPANAPRPSQGKFAEWSQQYKIPVDALVSDYVSNGGKGIAEMLMKRGTPDMQVSNGYAYDRNSLGAGYLPQLNISQDGKASLVQIGPNGLPVVSAPQGSLQTFNDYRRAESSLKPIKVYNPTTGREEYTNEAAVAQPGYASEPAMRRTAQLQTDGDTAAAAMREIAQMKKDLATPGKVPDASSRAALQSEIDRLSGQLSRNPSAQGGNYAAGPSAKETAESKAAEARAVDSAKADVVRDTSSKAASKLQGQIASAATLAGQLLDNNPTGSGAGALADSALNFIGQPTKSGDVAQQLEALSGWMVANVPRMEGPQSNADVLNYQTMAGRVGDRSLPISTRKAALQTVLDLQNKYASLNGGDASPPAQPEQPARPTFDSMPSPVQYKGKRIRDTTTGKILESDGLRWKEAQ